MDFRSRVINAIQTAGICLGDTNNDVDITEFINDSIQFISMILSLEEELGVEIQDEFLILDKFRSLNGLVIMLEDYISSGAK